MKAVRPLIALLFLLAAVRSEAAVPPEFSDTLVTSVGGPTALAFTPDGRLLISRQAGVLRVYSGGILLTTPAITLTGICTNSERGLLGIAIDPQFATNNYIYLYYTANKGGTCVNRTSRFTLPSTNVISSASELVLIDNIPSPAGNHNGGDVHFGADGLLYVSVGDGGCKIGNGALCAGQNDNARTLDHLLGKILRINKDGTIPPSNPRAGVAGARRCGDPAGVPAGNGPCSEMFSWGLRNPFRFSFRPGTNEFFINDVGQNTWEEIDLGASDADYGWNVREGFCALGSTTNCGAPPAGMTNPIFAYGRTTGCASITGGAFVPAGVWPAAYDGAYMYSDYVCGRIFTLTPNGTGGYNSSDFATGLGSGSAVHLLFGPYLATQSLYYTSYAGGGQVRRIDYTGPLNRPPVSVVTANPTVGPQPLQVDFDGSGSSDPDGDVLDYLWTFGDGASTTTTTATVSHTYTVAGSFTATLEVRDPSGALSDPDDTVQINVTSNTAPVLAVSSPASSYLFRVGETITLTGSATDAEEGTLPDSSLIWTVILHHGTHTHPFLGPVAGNNLTFQTPPPEDLAATANSYLEIQLTASDTPGLSSTLIQNLMPQLVDITFMTSPAGLSLTLNGAPVTGPTTVVSWPGYVLNVTAPNQIDGMARAATFIGWADGGGATRAISTPAADTTYLAAFNVGASISSLVPSSGDASGDTSSIFGTGFLTGASVFFGLNASGPAVITPNQIDVTTPALEPGQSWLVRVTNTDGTAAALQHGFFSNFLDVPDTYLLHEYVVRVARNKVTLGCGGGNYCPNGLVARQNMAAFLARAMVGGDENVPATGMVGSSPYDCTAGGTSVFSDVPPDSLFCSHVHYIAAQGVTLGCAAGLFCPSANVTRAQTAMFVARAMLGSDGAVPMSYIDPLTSRTYNCGASPNLHFSDVGATASFCRHTHYLWARDVIAGCTGTTYCPAPNVTRGQMAKFLVNGFALP